jgi:hypothetical protein
MVDKIPLSPALNVRGDMNMAMDPVCEMDVKEEGADDTGYVGDVTSLLRNKYAATVLRQKALPHEGSRTSYDCLALLKTS